MTQTNNSQSSTSLGLMNSFQIQFKVNFTLIDHLRNFSCNIHDHTYTDGFIEQIQIFLNHFKEKNPEFIQIESYLKEKNIDIPMMQIILGIHFYFASVNNLDLIIKNYKVSPISKQINNTNIMHIHSIYEALQQIKMKDLEHYQNLSSVQLDDYKMCLQKNVDQQIENDEVLQIDIDLIIYGIMARGNIDPQIVSYLCDKINRHYQVTIIPVQFQHARHPILFTESLAEQTINSLEMLKRFEFTKKHYKEYQKILVDITYDLIDLKKDEQELQMNVQNTLMDIENDLCCALLIFDQEKLHYLEKLLIGMLGHTFPTVRESAVPYLNALYDGVDWQLRGPIPTYIKSVGESFEINYLIESNEQKDSTLFIQLNCRSLSKQSNKSIVTWHIPHIKEYKSANQKEGQNYVQIYHDFGEFTKCGFYDWRLIKLHKNGKIKTVNKIYDMSEFKNKGLQTLNNLVLEYRCHQSDSVQGRYIVHPSNTSDLQIHEVFVDLEGQNSQNPQNKGKFSDVQKALDKYKSYGINCLYLMGIFERDNQKQRNGSYKRPDASPLAVTCRKTPCDMLGGMSEFKNLIKDAKKKNIRIVVDCLARVSSTRPQKQYVKDLVYMLDDQGKRTICYGTDGRAINFEDTALLNYRKKKIWDLLIQEILDFVKLYGIRGIHLDNGQSWPQIMILDQDEMFRVDPDGTRAYSYNQIFMGNVVIPNENCGYWSTQNAQQFANPFLVKLCRKIWENFEDFLIISESWEIPESQNREISIIKSGPIPRMFNLPQALSMIFGQKLCKDGTVKPCQKSNINIFRKWYEDIHKDYPQGSIVIQSTTSHIWPYPALLYKRGLWAAVDLFFFLPDIPMTFIGEYEGHAFRTKTTNIFTKITLKNDILDESICEAQDIQKQENTRKLMKKTISFMPEVKSRMKKTQSYLQDLINDDQLDQDINLLNTPSPSIVKIQSGVSISEIAPRSLSQAQQKFQTEIQLDHQEFDLKNIGRHYEHRSFLRHSKEVLRKGKLIPLSAENEFGWQSQVIVFARYIENQIVIVAINFSDILMDVILNLKNLKQLFENYQSTTCIAKVDDWLVQENNQRSNYFSIGELINDSHKQNLKPYGSVVIGIQIIKETPEILLESLKKSVHRLQSHIKNNTIAPYNQIATLLANLIQSTDSLQVFFNNFCVLCNQIFIPCKISLHDLINHTKQFQHNQQLISKLYSFVILLKKFQILQFQAEISVACNFVDQNQMKGGIVIVTPQLYPLTGKSIMLDTLSQGLQNLGLKINIIVPYYQKMDEKFKSQLVKFQSFDLQIGREYYSEVIKMEIYYIQKNGVDIFFLKHNKDNDDNLFIKPLNSQSGDYKYAIRQITVFGKGVLEALCQMKLIPDLIMTNDFFSGLIPTYAKLHFFGDVFDQTKFFHVIHNMEEEFEGRIKTNHELGTMSNIHCIPDEYLVDPYWQEKLLNPSRAALLCCDQWGTVSHSYKKELIRKSPLSQILNKKQKPFSCNNGIHIKEYINKLNSICQNEHLTAKKLIQQKYFNYEHLNDEMILFCFIGRITQAKGVLLILESVELLINKYQSKIQIIIAGEIYQGDLKKGEDKYLTTCLNLMQKLRNKYIFNFWASPYENFQDTELLMKASNYGMIPSLFETSGIILNQYFASKTPIIGYKIGTIKDQTIDYEKETQKGNGFLFQEYKTNDFIFALERAIQIFHSKNDYEILRKNAFESAIDQGTMAQNWEKEFKTLMGKIKIDQSCIESQQKIIQNDLIIESINPDYNIQQEECRMLNYQDSLKKNFEKVLIAHKKANLRKQIFTYDSNKQNRPKMVFVTGSFNDWEKKYQLHFDHFNQIWMVTIQLQPGEYFYKFIVDDEWVCNDDDPVNNDQFGIVNNYIVVL